MRLGLLAWLTALCILSMGEPTWLVIASQTLNGVCVCCFLVAGQVFINGQAHGDIRVSAQSLLSFVSSLGLLVGNLLVGFVRWQMDERFRPTYAVGAGLAAVLAVGFWLGFREEDTPSQKVV
jgi:MFS family permease